MARFAASSPHDIPILEGHGPEVALFDHLYTDTAKVKSECFIYKAEGMGNPGLRYLDFNIPGDHSRYLDLQKTRLYLLLKLERADGSRINADDNVCLINLCAQTMFSNVELSLCHKSINPMPTGLYPYKCYLDTLLKASEAAKETWLQGSLWYPDSPSYFNEVSDRNYGADLRKMITADSKFVELESEVNVDFFKQKRLLMWGMSVQLKFWLHTNEFKIMARNPDDTAEKTYYRGGYRVVIHDAILKTTQVTLAPEVVVAQNAVILKNPAVYYYKRTDLKAYPVGKDARSFSKGNFWNGAIPSKLLVCFASSDAFNGSYATNLFLLHHVHLSNFRLLVDGAIQGGKPLTPDFEENRYVEAYMSLYGSLDLIGRNIANNLTLESYKGGAMVIATDIDGQHSEGHRQLEHFGSIDLSVTFKKPLEEEYQLIVVGIFQEVLRCDYARNYF